MRNKIKLLQIAAIIFAIIGFIAMSYQYLSGIINTQELLIIILIIFTSIGILFLVEKLFKL